MLRAGRLLAILAVFGVCWYLLAPPAYGGATSITEVSGHSMLPTLQPGDLVAVRAADSYAVGDIVEYRTPPGAIFVHRILSIDGGVYSFKGDNNDFVDPFRVTEDHIVGKLWVRIPNGAAVVNAFRSPLVLGVAVAVVLVVLATGGRRYARSRRRAAVPAAPGRRSVPGEQPPVSGRRMPALSSVVATVCVAALAIAGVAFVRPVATSSTVVHQVSQTADFTYSAAAPSGLVGPGGGVGTGDPIFLKTTGRIAVTFHYRVSGAGLAETGGTYAMTLTVAGTSGWHQDVPLVVETPFSGDGYAATATVDLTAVEVLMRRAAGLTGDSGTTATLTVVPPTSLDGSVAGTRFHATFAPALRFTLDSVEMRLAGTPEEATAQLHATGNVAVPVPAIQAAVVSVPGVTVPVTTLRAGALAVAALCAAVLLGMTGRRRRRGPERHLVGAHHVRITSVATPPDDSGAAVDVLSIEDLARLAGGTPILEWSDAEGHHYYTAASGVVYRYTSPTPV